MKQENAVPDRAATLVVHPTAGIGDATTIEDAVAMIVTMGGGEIFLREGTYAPAATIDLPDLPISIKGVGNGVVITSPSGLPLFSVTTGFTSRYFFSGFSVTGDDSVGNALINLDSDVDVSFVEVHTSSVRDIVVTSGAPEVSFSFCSFSMTAANNWSFWRGSATGGLLIWDYVDVTVGATQSTAGIVGVPDWEVTGSYIGGGGPAKTVCDCGKVTFQGFRMHKIRLFANGDGSTMVNVEGIDSRYALSNARSSIVGSTFTTPTLVDNQIIICDGPGGTGGVNCDIAISGCTFDGSNIVFEGIGVEVLGVVISGCSFSNIGAGNATDGAVTLGSFANAEMTVIGCKFFNTSPDQPIYEFNINTIRGFYDNNLGAANSVIISPFSTIDGVRRFGGGVTPPGDGTGTTTAAFVELFTHKNKNGVVGTGHAKNTGGVNSMDVRISVTDAFGTSANATSTVAPGADLLLDPAANIGTARSPYVSYKVEVKDTVAASHTTFNTQFSSTGPY